MITSQCVAIPNANSFGDRNTDPTVSHKCYTVQERTKFDEGFSWAEPQLVSFPWGVPKFK